jgi:hypothetical protein
VSRGPGRAQRKILKLLEAQPDRSLSRRDIDAVLVDEDGHDPSNVRRAIRGLQRMRRVGLAKGRSLDDSLLTLPSPPRPVSDDEVFALLAQINEASAEVKR